MIYYKTKDEVELIRKSSLLVSETLAYTGSLIKPGITTLFLDQKAEEFIRDHGAQPAFKGYQSKTKGVPNFPASLCISINDEVVHGIPSKREIRETDVVSVDCGVYKNGFFGDSAYTFLLGGASLDAVNLVKNTKESLYRGIEMAISGNRIGDISFAIQSFCEDHHGYGVVRQLVGHGLGRNLHEEPEVPNFGARGKGPKMLEGLVIAIEPMINLGTRNVVQDNDGWTIRTRDGEVSCHFEHNVALRKGPADILSSFGPIEEAERNNRNLYFKTVEVH